MTERERLIELLNKYFEIGDSDFYICNRVKEAFNLGTMTLDDFSEIDEENTVDIADYLLANGVIVLPCKVGDEVWINNKYGTIKSKVSNITIIEDNKFLVKLHYDVRYCYDNHIETLGHVGYTEENFEFGKTVFLTREEAEKALEAKK